MTCGDIIEFTNPESGVYSIARVIGLYEKLDEPDITLRLAAEVVSGSGVFTVAAGLPGICVVGHTDTELPPWVEEHRGRIAPKKIKHKRIF